LYQLKEKENIFSMLIGKFPILRMTEIAHLMYNNALEPMIAAVRVASEMSTGPFLPHINNA
jgi:hypothetical protein